MNLIVKYLRKFNARINKYAPTYYVLKLNKNEKLLDVGCGNNSPQRYKNISKDIIYYGVDIGEHNQDKHQLKEYADFVEYSDSKNFHKSVYKNKKDISLVISSHNIEHCENPLLVIDSMCNSLKKGGILYMAFPCEESVNFPSRLGTLNFYDDNTHLKIPNYNEIMSRIIMNNLKIIIMNRRRRFLPLAILGFIKEPYSRIKKRVFRGTWDYWGFESIIVAKKN